MNKQEFIQKLQMETGFFNELLSKLKISKDSFMAKLNNFNKFNLGEVIHIKSFLNLSMDEVINLFYSPVANCNIRGAL